MFKHILLFSLVALSILFTACGGGGSSDTSNINNSSGTQATAALKNTVIQIDTSNETVIVNSTESTTDLTVLEVSQNTIDKLKKDDVFFIPPEPNGQFPLGFARKVDQIDDSQNKLYLSEIPLNMIIASVKKEDTSIPLTSDNFIGVIAPNTVKAAQKLTRSTNDAKIEKSFLNGGVRFVKKQSNSRNIANISEIIELEVEIDLDDFTSDDSALVSNGGVAGGKVVLTGVLNNLTLNEANDIDILKGKTEFNFEVEGDFKAQLSLEGLAKLNVGVFNRIWESVEDSGYDLLGFKGKITGLDSDDKYGKYPIMGLVFVSPSPVIVHGIETAVTMANAAGVIVWVYADAKGEITIDGSIGVRANSHFRLGVKKPKNTSLSLIKEMSSTDNDRLIEAPFVEGSLTTKVFYGMSIEADSFLLGVRMANAGIDVGGSYTMTFSAHSLVSYGINDFGDDWFWEGGFICIEGQAGAGMIASADVALGYELKADLGVWEKDVAAGFSYSIQYPNEDDIAAKSEAGWVGTWYVFNNQQACFNEGSNNSFSTSSLSSSSSSSTSSTPQGSGNFIYSTIISPVTGKVWMDRNLGAKRVCQSQVDSKCFGDYYQWGRLADGHQLKNSDSVATMANSLHPKHGKFIYNPDGASDWTTVDQNGLKRQHLWNPCPNGYRVPTINELLAETKNAGFSNASNVATGFLKIPSAGIRLHDTSNGYRFQNTNSILWSIDISSSKTSMTDILNCSTDSIATSRGFRGGGMPVRCISASNDGQNSPIECSMSQKLINGNCVSKTCQVDGYNCPICLSNEILQYNSDGSGHCHTTSNNEIVMSFGNNFSCQEGSRYYYPMQITNNSSKNIEIVAISGYTQDQCLENITTCEHSKTGYFPNFASWFSEGNTECEIDGKLIVKPGQTCSDKTFWTSRYLEDGDSDYYYFWYKEAESDILLSKKSELLTVYHASNTLCAERIKPVVTGLDIWEVHDEGKVSTKTSFNNNGSSNIDIIYWYIGDASGENIYYNYDTPENTAEGSRSVTWTYADYPNLFKSNGTYEVYTKVMNEDGAWSDIYKKTILLENITNSQ